MHGKANYFTYSLSKTWSHEKKDSSQQVKRVLIEYVWTGMRFLLQIDNNSTCYTEVPVEEEIPENVLEFCRGRQILHLVPVECNGNKYF